MLARPRAALRDYQLWAVDLIKKKSALCLALDMGSGKTVSALTAARDLICNFTVNKVLIVAPKLVAEATWPDEIEAWEHTKWLSYSILVGDEKTVCGRADEDTYIHIVNKERLPLLWDHFGRGERWPYDMLILDEASMCKNGSLRVTQKDEKTGKIKRPSSDTPLSRFGVLAHARRKFSKVVLLTGTPTPKGLENLWGISFIIDLGKRLGSQKDSFLARYFHENKYSRKRLPQEHAFDEILEKIKDVFFSIDPKHYVTLPPVNSNSIWVNLPPKVLKQYKQFERDSVSEEYDVEAVNAGVLFGKLHQFANGSMYQEDGEDVWIHDVKLEALENLVDELNGEPLIVAYSYKFDCDRIRKKFPKAVVLNEEADPRKVMKDWNAGKIDMLLAHPASAGHGLNLQYGGCHAAWYGLTPDLELYQQFNKRLARPGQTRPVWLHHILARKTKDEDRLPQLAERAAVQDRVLEAVRVEIR